ncbi:hypothetical protein HHI36_012379 [Cryptolaemus montrouzieri]|uniref:Chitin-binding type-2 domain-containing protein n=1 Tax=Cryptolaemus montrouzieri TaxID=559131 RepID=A0ABD2NFA0_9CUCU
MFKQVFFGLLFYSAVVLSTVNAQITKSSFSCDGRVSGYYADVGAGCQVYHMCDGLGRKFSFVCPNATLFQQRMLICDHWFMVNCSRSESDYGANLLIGQKGKPFVEDSGGSSFQRTPRPDYANGDSEKNSAIYQNRVDPLDDADLVGVNSDENQNESKQYNLPSRWSTQYTKIAPTADPKEQLPNVEDSSETLIQEQSTRPTKNRLGENLNKQRISEREFPINFESKYKATTPVYPSFVEDSLKFSNFELAPPKTQPGISKIEEINNLQNPGVSHENNDNLDPVNFESHYNATTPVYPLFVDEALKLNDLVLTPPVVQSETDNVVVNRNKEEDSREDHVDTPVPVNFASNFKATTPVYPTSVDDNLKLNDLDLYPPLTQGTKNDNTVVKVNFVSNFEATTPVYPLSVEATSPIPDEIGLLPPLGEVPKQGQEIQEITTRIPVNFESNFLATVPNYPTSVESTSPLPDEVGLLPPIKNDPSGRFLNFEPKDQINQQSNENKPADEPSQYYEPPLYGTGYVNPNGALADYSTNSKHMVSVNVEDWGELRRKLSVPDYEFPLDSAAHRASYDSDLSSFQPRPSGLQQR